MSDLVDRLRGKYVIPVRDGAGPLNGKDTFTRQFDTPPIHHEAADRIELLENTLRNMTGNFRTSLLLCSSHEARAMGMDLVRDAEKILRQKRRIDRTAKTL